MKVTLVPKIEITRKHPKGMTCATDAEYARIATEILKKLAKLNITDIPVEGLKKIAVNVVMYFEDIVSGTGIWNGFTDKVKELYGRRLPFYDVDENNYFQDEPNFEDIKLIVWYTMLEVHHGKIGNPENPFLEQMADVAYSVLEDHYETVPENDELKNYLCTPENFDDFYKMRDVLKWLCYGCYLTYIPNIVEHLFAAAREFAHSTQMYMDPAYYQVESLMVYSQEIGPLQLLPQQWLGMILRAAGNEKAAKDVEAQRVIDYQPNKIVAVDDANNWTFEATDGETFKVLESELNFPVEECRDRKVVIGSFVEYRGEWHLNGGCAWSESLDDYNSIHDDKVGHDKLHPVYDKLVKENGGSRLFYFADTAALKKFVLENMPFDDEVKKNFSLPEGHEKIALFVPEDYDDFQIFPDGALCIKDERNPYYNEKWARNQSLNFVLSVGHDMRTYLISNGMLPDATINSSKGVERGNEIVQQNFDFITRAVSSRL